MNIKDFKVGQTVFVELTGNAIRWKTEEECVEEWEITYVGKKYIKAGKINKYNGKVYGEVTFEYRDNYYKRFVNKTNVCVDYVLYLDKKEIEEKHEKQRLFNEISKFFGIYSATQKLSLERLRKIKEILEEKNDI